MLPSLRNLVERAGTMQMEMPAQTNFDRIYQMNRILNASDVLTLRCDHFVEPIHFSHLVHLVHPV